MAEKNLVGITNQSFMEAGGSREFPNLEMGKTVLVVTREKDYTLPSLFEIANELLSNAAKEKGYTHLFGVEYIFGYFHGQHPSWGGDIKATATGYRPKSQ